MTNWLITKTYYRSSSGREIKVVQNLLVAQLRLLITEVIDDFPFGRRKSHKCLTAKLSRSTELFHELSAHLKEFFVTVPVALEEFVDGLDTETKEEDDNLELAKGDGVHENQLPEEKHNMYFSDSTTYISSRVTKKVNYWRKSPSFLLGGHHLTIGLTRVQGWLGVLCSRV